MDPIDSCDKRQILGVVDSSSTGTTATDNTSTTTDTASGSRTQTRCTRPGSGAQEMDPCTTEFDQLSKETKHLKAQLSSTKSGSSVSHQELYTAAVNTCHTIPALPRNDDDNDDDNDATALPRQTGSFFFDPETKSAEPVRQRSRRSGIDSVNGGRIDSAVRRHSNVDSIAAVSDIISMILAPMVIVPFLDFCALGKIPRSNTAKPGGRDGPTAKMGSPNSISQPIGDGWTVIFVSVRFLPQPTQMHTRLYL